jgi:hypothetical protein
MQAGRGAGVPPGRGTNQSTSWFNKGAVRESGWRRASLASRLRSTTHYTLHKDKDPAAKNEKSAQPAPRPLGLSSGRHLRARSEIRQAESRNSG